MIEAFSKRSAEIEAAIGGDRGAASGSQKEVAALATRGAKADLPTGAELERRWRTELAAFAIDPWAAVREAARHRAPVPDHDIAHDVASEPDFDPPACSGDTPVARAASALFRHQNVIDRKHLIEQALNEAALQGVGIAAVRAEIASLEDSGDLVRLNAGEPEACWTTPGIAAAEAALLRATDRPDAGSRFLPQAVSRALAAAPQLSEEQRAAVAAVTGPEAGGVSVLEAGAGTGKTVTANVIVAAAQASGMKVVGLAPSWAAAVELGRSTGIETFAIAKWRHDLEHGRIPPLDADTVLLCDEAGMVGTKDLAFVLSAVAAAPDGGSRAILLGDRRQLAAVSGGSALRAVVDVLGRHTTLTEVRRQEVSWQRAASVLMARGDVEGGLRAYARHERIELVGGDAPAQERVVALWTEARASHGDSEVLMVTRRNRDAASLNAAARAVLRAEGVLTGAEVEVTARDRENKRVALAVAYGDRVRFGEGIQRHGIRNGTRATVTAVGSDGEGVVRLRVQLEDGRVIEDAFSGFVRAPIPGAGRRETLPRITHAYAGTAYSVQGRTAAACVYYGATASDARELYVGLTRHRRDAWLVAERERLEAAVRARGSDPRCKPSTSELTERLFVEARRYAEKVNVVEHVEDRETFVRTGTIRPHRSETTIDITRGFEAGRALRAALQDIQAAPRLALWHLTRLVQGTERVVAQGFAELVEALRLPPPPRRERESERSRSTDRSNAGYER